MAKELLLEFKGFVNKDDINKSQFRIFGNIKLDKGVNDNLIIDSSEFDIYDVGSITHIDKYDVKGDNFVGHKNDVYDIFNNVILSILRNEMKKDDIIFVHNSIKKFIKNYYNVACVYNGRNILKELFLDVDYSLNIYKLDFATNDFAYYSNIDGEMIMINILDGSILGTIYPFIEGAIYDSIENIKNGKEQLIYGDYKPFEDALDMD